MRTVRLAGCVKNQARQICVQRRYQFTPGMNASHLSRQTWGRVTRCFVLFGLHKFTQVWTPQHHAKPGQYCRAAEMVGCRPNLKCGVDVQLRPFQIWFYRRFVALALVKGLSGIPELRIWPLDCAARHQRMDVVDISRGNSPLSFPGFFFFYSLSLCRFLRFNSADLSRYFALPDQRKHHTQTLV